MARVPRVAWVILAVALLLRAGAALVVTDQLPAGVDEGSYLRIAASVAAGDGFPDREVGGGSPDGASAIVPPGFPYTLGAVFAVSGDSIPVARTVTVALGTLTVALLGAVAWLVWRTREIATAAMGIGAVYPPLVFMSVPVMSEALFLPLALAAIAAALKYRDTDDFRWALAAGALCGAAILTKNIGFVLAAAVALLVWRTPTLSWRAARVPAAALLCAAVVVAPWTVRNAVEFDRFVPVSNELGVGLAGTYNDATRDDPLHEWRPPFQLPEFRSLALHPDLSEAAMTAELEDHAVEFIGDHPSYPLAVAYRNGRRLLELRGFGRSALDAQLLGFGTKAAGSTTLGNIARLNTLGFLALVVLAVLTLFRQRGLGRLPWQLAAFAVAVVLPLVFIAAGTRMRLPADLILVVLAAPTAALLTERLRHRVRRQEASAAS